MGPVYFYVRGKLRPLLHNDVIKNIITSRAIRCCGKAFFDTAQFLAVGEWMVGGVDLFYMRYF